MALGRLRLGLVVLAIALACALVPGIAAGDFGDPGVAPGDNPRDDTPIDPEFDRCEADDPDDPPDHTDEPDCTTYFEEEYRAFGFSPDTANEIADPGGLLPHYTTGTHYKDCLADPDDPNGQLDAQGQAANLQAEAPVPPDPVSQRAARCLQIGGVRADSAWKYSTGDPDTVIAILDTGIRWQERDLVNKIHLNRGELPVPQGAGGSACPPNPHSDLYDCNGDRAFDVRDYADDPRVSEAAGDQEADDILDASDLIATFSAGAFPGGISGAEDDDGNGYLNDIAGWDFFDDDNDPYDASSCCSANGHGTGRAREAAAETNNTRAGVGMCPDCQVMPLRVWDTFVVPGDNYAMGVVYATENGASVVEGAVGGLTNTRFARSAFRHADESGVALTLVSSDINSANHNYPTNYNEAIYVGGSLPDTAPNETCQGPGGLPGLPDFPGPPDDFAAGCTEFIGLLDELSGCNADPPDPFCISPTPANAQPITTSFFRNSNLTQYGGKADIVLMGATGSENTGQASGAAGLLASYGREELGSPLSGNEIRQLLTMTAEDVRPINTGTIGQPDKANDGWDPHFGYGRVNLAAAMARIEAGVIPPEAQIDSPDWFAPVNVDRLPESGLVLTGRAAAPHGEVGSWELEYACGADALDADFQPVPGASGTGAVDGEIGTIPKALLTELADTDNCDGSVANDAGRPAGASADAWPENPYPDPDPERHSVQLRLTVHDADETPAAPNIGRYRKTIFPYRDDGNLPGWPRPLGSGSDADKLVTGSGGEVSPRLYDVDGDNALDVLQATSSGELHALHADGTPVASFNGGQPVTTDPIVLATAGRIPAEVPVPNEPLRVPAIGDVDGDREAEIVATAGEHVYVWALGGQRELKIRLDPSLSEPCVPGVPKPCFNTADRAITSSNHIKRGFFGSPALADLDGDGILEIVATALDQHLYAFSGLPGVADRDLPNFPVKLESEGADGAEIVTSPAIADLDGDDTNGPEVIVATNEVIGGDAQPEFPPIFALISFFLESSTGSNPVYAVHGNGVPLTEAEGWPVKVGVAAGDLLPLVLPGHDSAVLDVDGDGDDEVSVSAGTSVMPGGARLVDGNGEPISSYTNPASPELTDQGPILNLADYQSVGDLTGDGTPDVIKGGLTVNGAANLLAVNQNLPFNHVEQAFDPETGTAVPGYPIATDDFQLVSQASIARVAGDGDAHQALVGTGLYNLHAYGPDGTEPQGSTPATSWPKFTGGWQQATPAVGDSDGDGDLDVTTLTREGWSFLWDTGVDACDGSNEEWWTFHHDERSSANYGTDGRPPGTPEDLVAVRGSAGVVLSWTAPGDDWLCGKADRYRLLVANGPIDHPSDGTLIREAGAGAASGETETTTVTNAELGSATHFAVLYRDEAGNWGLLADAPIPAAGGGGGSGGGGSGGGGGGPCSNRLLGTAGKDRLRGTPGSDMLRGRAGNDRLAGRGGDDCVNGGRGKDRLRGGRGDDQIRARRGGRDRINCGPGKDTVRINPGKDRVKNCEKVRTGTR